MSIQLTEEVVAARLAIIDDVIAQVKAEKTKVIHNHYVCQQNIRVFDGLFDNSAQQEMDKIQENCKFCLLGSMLISHVRLHNKLSVDNVLWSGRIEIADALKEYFWYTELKRLERRFEYFSDYPEYEKYVDPTDCLLAIMKDAREQVAQGLEIFFN